MCICDSTDTEESLICRRCRDFFHNACEAIYSLPAIEVFFCSQCEISFANLTTYKTIDPDKDDGTLTSSFYEVAQILKHKKIGNKTIYLVRWDGYPVDEATWEPEGNLLCCQPLLMKYKKSSNLGNAEGAPMADCAHYSTKNPCIEVLTMLRTFFESYDYPTQKRLSLSLFNANSFNRDEICLLPFRQHIYVLLYFKSLKLGFIADSANNYILSRSLRYTLRKYLGFRIFGISFESRASFQDKIRAAAMISIIFCDSYHSYTVPSKINISERDMERIKAINW